MPQKKEWKITAEEWEKAIAYLADKPDGEKFKKNNSQEASDKSFVKIAGVVYAMSNKEFFEPLGAGAFGKVKMVENRTGDKFAVKIEGRGLRSEQDAESKIGKLLGYIHGEAVRDLGAGKNFLGRVTRKKLYTVMKLYEGSELAKEIYHNGDYTKRTQNKHNTVQKGLIALKACQAIQALHDKGIIHADIKPANFIANIVGNVITLNAIDFGLSMIKEPGESYVQDFSKGTPLYKAPEIQGRYKIVEFSEASDAFALGIMFRNDFQMQPDEIYADMIKADPKDRGTIINAMSKIITALKKEDLDDDARKTVEEIQRFVREHQVASPQSLLFTGNVSIKSTLANKQTVIENILGNMQLEYQAKRDSSAMYWLKRAGKKTIRKEQLSKIREMLYVLNKDDNMPSINKFIIAKALLEDIKKQISDENNKIKSSLSALINEKINILDEKMKEHSSNKDNLNLGVTQRENIIKKFKEAHPQIFVTNESKRKAPSKK